MQQRYTKNGVYASGVCELLPGKHYWTEEDIKAFV